MARGIVWQTQLSLAAGSISASYALVGTLVTIGRCVFINNLTNADLQLSFDGTNGHLPIAARTGEVVDVMANSKPGNAGDDGAVQPNLTKFYVKLIGSAPGTFTGSIYISYWCESGE